MYVSFEKVQNSKQTWLKLNLVHWVILWALSFFISQVVFADPDGRSIGRNSHLTAGGNTVTVQVDIYDTPEAFAQQQAATQNTSNKFLSIVNLDRLNEIKNKWSSVLTRGMHYIEYPADELRRHFSRQANFYQTEKYSLVVLSAMTGAAAFNWFILADTGTIGQQSFLVALNAVLYGYLLVNVDNWQSYLRNSERLVQSIRRLRDRDHISTSNERLFANLGANFTFFLIYNLSIQGILNWSDLSVLFGQDMIRFMLTTAAFGTATTGIWDSTFRRWYLNSSISKTSLIRLNWSESFVMTTIQALIAMGFSEGYVAIAAHGLAGLSALVLSTNRVASGIENLRDKAKWTLQRGRIALQSLSEVIGLNSATTASPGGQMCSNFLSN